MSQTSHRIAQSQGKWTILVLVPAGHFWRGPELTMESYVNERADSECEFQSIVDLALA